MIDLRVEDMIKRSFCEFGTQRHESRYRTLLAAGVQFLADAPPVDCIYGEPDLIHQFFELDDERSQIAAELNRMLLNAGSCDRYFNTGRVLVLSRFNLNKARYRTAACGFKNGWPFILPD